MRHAGSRSTTASLQQRMFDAFIAAAKSAVLEAAPAVTAAAAAAVPAQPAAVACVYAGSLLSRQQPGGYGLHPAVIDCSTHTLAALLGCVPNTREPDLQVPVALEAIVCAASHTREKCDHQALDTTAALKYSTDSGSVLSSIRLLAAHDLGIHMSGFQVKVGIVQCHACRCCTSPTKHAPTKSPILRAATGKKGPCTTAFYAPETLGSHERPSSGTYPNTFYGPAILESHHRPSAGTGLQAYATGHRSWGASPGCGPGLSR